MDIRRLLGPATWSHIKVIAWRLLAAIAGTGLHGNPVTAPQLAGHHWPLTSLPADDKTHATFGHDNSTRHAVAARSRRDHPRPAHVWYCCWRGAGTRSFRPLLSAQTCTAT